MERVSSSVREVVFGNEGSGEGGGGRGGGGGVEHLMDVRHHVRAGSGEDSPSHYSCLYYILYIYYLGLTQPLLLSFAFGSHLSARPSAASKSSFGV